MTSGCRLLSSIVWLSVTAGGAAAQLPARPLSADHSFAELSRTVEGLTVTARVLVIGMRPEDEDAQLMTWLSRGHHVETAYLSITRGEAGHAFGGNEAGATLGAIRTEEALAARRIDGAKQFYTRAFDFGFARDTDNVLKHWERDSIVGDMVAVIRSFRPHVIVAVLSDSIAALDGQHHAFAQFLTWALLASSAVRYAPERFGTPWSTPKVYRYGIGLRVETAGYDRVLGKTYGDLALQVRAQQRSQGLLGLTVEQPTLVELERVGPRIGANLGPDQSFFGGVDTSFARLSDKAPPALASSMSLITVYTDSARRALDIRRPSVALPYLAQIARLATSVRGASPWCQHPSANAQPPAVWTGPCDPKSLDLDASIDLVHERAVSALLVAAGVSIEATADRELVATGDTADVTVSVTNHGIAPITLEDVAISGSLSSASEPNVVVSDSTIRVRRRVSGLADSHPWWVGPRGGKVRGGDRFAAVSSSIDGVSRTEAIPASLRVLGVAVPENIRRSSDATVTLTVAGVSVTTSVGPIIYRHADAQVGLQNRPVAGVPTVTLQFARGLDWIPRNKPIVRALPITIRSHSDHEQQIALGVLAPNGIPKGLRIDSLPRSMRLGPHEEREIFLELRGRLESTQRDPLGVQAAQKDAARDSTAVSPDQLYQTGFQTVQRDYLPPIRLFGSSGEWLQPIDINVPAGLTTLYISGARDEIASSLAEVGVYVREITSTDQLASVEYARVTTVAIGAGVLDAKPEVLRETGRLLDFVRKGGTLVVLRTANGNALSQLLPYPVSLARSIGERAMNSDAPLRALDAKAGILNWPNKTGEPDWADWVGERAEWMPSTVDPRFATVVEVHDPGQPENRNAILVARIGKGTIIYSALTLDQQIAGGVPGSLRLLVNMLSVGLTSAP